MLCPQACNVIIVLKPLEESTLLVKERKEALLDSELFAYNIWLSDLSLEDT